MKASDKEALISAAETVGFGKFIDIEEYVENAGKPNYDTFTLIAIDVPSLAKEEDGISNGDGNILYEYTWRIPVYFYNPLHESFYCNEFSMVLGDGYARVKDFDDLSFNGYSLTYPQEPGYDSVDDMFIAATIVGTFNLGDENLENQFYDISSVCIGDYKFNINRTIGFSDLDETINFTGPLGDLSRFTNTDRGDLLDKFPSNANDTPHIAYFYESNYNSENFNYFLYIYDPSNKIKGGPVSVEIYVDNIYKSFLFDYLCTEDQIVKYKIRSPLRISSGEIRDYYITSVSGVSFDISTKTHYQFSESSLNNVNNGLFYGNFQPYIITDDLQEGDELLVSFDQNNYDDFEFNVD